MHVAVACCRTIDWNYCILDEGHVIKNTKTKVRVHAVLFKSVGIPLKLPLAGLVKR